MTNLDRMHSLLNQLEIKLKSNSSSPTTQEHQRGDNLKKLEILYIKLELSKKVTEFQNIFHYKAMKLAGIGLKNEDFGEIREGKYIQIIAIEYIKNDSGKSVAKNISLGYYGKAEKLLEEKKHNIIEFILRWRYEKTFQHTEHYQQLLSKLH